MAGREVQRRFLIQKRIAFTLAILLGLSAMWILAMQTAGLRSLSRWPLLGAALCFFLLSAAIRTRSRWLQTTAFYLAFITLGGGIGTLSPPGNGLLNPTVLVGLTALGVTINTIVFKKERTRFAEFLLSAPWLVAACVICVPVTMQAALLPRQIRESQAKLTAQQAERIIFPNIIDADAVVIMLMLFLSAEVALQIFKPKEHIFAAADVVPIVFLLAWRGWSGQN